VQAIEVDLADPDGPAQLAAVAGDRIDILVNNVGGAPARTGGFLRITDQDWLATLNLNLLAAVRTTRAVVPAMLTAGHGAIITICSVNAKLPDPAVLDYSVAKAGLASFSKALSKELGPHGIRVNTISPGPVATDHWLGAGGVAQTISHTTGAPAEAEERLLSLHVVTAAPDCPRTGRGRVRQRPVAASCSAKRSGWAKWGK
jgi:NAD(P)-dependent dehydrogenase (short-subunit alcohol dehydrogenase family)